MGTLRDLTGTEVRWLAMGYYSHFYKWRIHPRALPWLVAAMIGLVVVVAAGIWVMISLDQSSSSITVAAGEVTIESRGDGTAYLQDGKELVKEHGRSSPEYPALALFFIVAVFMFGCLLIATYKDSHYKSDYLDSVVERWEGGDHTLPLPSPAPPPQGSW